MQHVCIVFFFSRRFSCPRNQWFLGCVVCLYLAYPIAGVDERRRSTWSRCSVAFLLRRTFRKPRLPFRPSLVLVLTVGVRRCSGTSLYRWGCPTSTEFVRLSVLTKQTLMILDVCFCFLFGASLRFYDTSGFNADHPSQFWCCFMLFFRLDDRKYTRPRSSKHFIINEHCCCSISHVDWHVPRRPFDMFSKFLAFFELFSPHFC